MRITYFLTVSLAAGTAAAFVSTYGFHDGSSRIPWGLLLPFSLPGVLIAAPLALFGIGNVHDLNLTEIVVVDFLFYSSVTFKLLQRLERRRAS